jgi:hypothetical protein
MNKNRGGTHPIAGQGRVLFRMIRIVLMLEVVLTDPDHHEGGQEEIDQHDQKGRSSDLCLSRHHEKILQENKFNVTPLLL